MYPSPSPFRLSSHFVPMNSHIIVTFVGPLTRHLSWNFRISGLFVRWAHIISPHTGTYMDTLFYHISWLGDICQSYHSLLLLTTPRILGMFDSCTPRFCPLIQCPPPHFTFHPLQGLWFYLCPNPFPTPPQMENGVRYLISWNTITSRLHFVEEEYTSSTRKKACGKLFIRNRTHCLSFLRLMVFTTSIMQGMMSWFRGNWSLFSLYPNAR